MEAPEDGPPTHWRLSSGPPTREGRFGPVFRALDLDSPGRLYSVERVTCRHQTAKVLLATVEKLRTLRHRHLQSILGAVTTPSGLDVFGRLCPGPTLRSIVALFGALEPSLVISFTHQILLGLRFLHRNGFAHGALQSAFVSVGPRGSVRIMNLLGAHCTSAALTSPLTSSCGSSPASISGSAVSPPTLKLDVEPGATAGNLPPTVQQDSSPPPRAETPPTSREAKLEARLLKRAWRRRQRQDVWDLGCVVSEILEGKPCPHVGEGGGAYYNSGSEGGGDDGVDHCSVPHHTTTSAPFDEVRVPVGDGVPAEATAFLRLCFRRAVDRRPSVSALLRHSLFKARPGGQVEDGAEGSSSPTPMDTSALSSPLEPALGRGSLLPSPRGRGARPKPSPLGGGVGGLPVAWGALPESPMHAEAGSEAAKERTPAQRGFPENLGAERSNREVIN